MNSSKKRLGVLAAAVLAAVLTACGDSRSDAELVASARSYLTAGDNAAAAIELRNALQKNANNAEARFLLGEASFAVDDLPTAEKELARAWELGYDQAAIVPLLAQTQSLLGRHDEVFKLYSDALDAEGRGVLRAAQARAHLQLGESYAAREAVEEAMSLAGEDAFVRLSLARVLRSEGDRTAARQQVATVLEQQAAQLEGLFLSAELAELDSDLPAATEAYTRLVELRPNDAAQRFRKSLMLVQTGDLDGAEREVKVLLRLEPKNPGAPYVQGLIHFYRGAFRDALDSFTLAESGAEQLPLLAFLNGAAYFMLGDAVQAETHLARFHSRVPSHLPGRVLLGALRLSQQRPAEAESLLRPVVDVLPGDPIPMNLLAAALLEQGESAEALDLLERVAAAQPDSAQARLQLGISQVAAGERELGVQTLQQAVEKDPSLARADVAIALSHLSAGDGAAALAAASAYAERNPQSAAPLNLIGRIHAELGQLDEARQAYKQAQAMQPDDASAVLHLGLLEQSQGNSELAQAQFTQHLTKYPQQAAVRVALAGLLQEAGDLDAAIDQLTQAVETAPTLLEPRLRLAGLRLQRGQSDQVAAAFDGLDAMQRRNPGVVKLTALSQLATNQIAEAADSLEGLLADDPGAAPLHFLLAAAYQRAGNAAMARQSVQAAHTADADYVPARVMMARMALRSFDDAAYKEHRDYLRERLPDASELKILEAEAATQAGDTRAALALLESAYQEQPNTRTLLAYAEQLWRQDQSSEARALLEDWLQTWPEDAMARGALSDLLAQAGETNAQIQAYRDILATDAGNVVALNNLAYLLAEREPSEALQLAERAQQLAPNVPEFLDTLALAQSYSGRHPDAIRSADAALRLRSDDPGLQYRAAWVRWRAGDSTAARRQLEQLLSSRAEFAQRADAEALLERL